MPVSSVIRLLKGINLLKTIHFNFHYFPIKTAIRMPFFIYRRSNLYKMKGKIIIDSPVRTGMVRFGSHILGTQDTLYPRSMWEVSGTLIVKEKANIGRGSKISIGENAVLSLGENFEITGNSEIICQKEVSFGKGCLLSWNILIMDTDFHNIVDAEGNILNIPKPVLIGNHVWIGCRSTILKGVSIADNTVISASSTITRCITEQNCVIGGHGKSIEILKRNVNWER